MTSKMLLAVLGLCLATAACAPDGSGGMTNVAGDLQTMSASVEGQSPAQRTLAERQQSYAKVRVQSAAVGALGGFLLCQMQGCTSQQQIAATMAGAAAGYMAGGYLTNQNQAFQATQQTLQRDIELAAQDNRDAEASVVAAQDVVTFQRQEIARLNTELAAGTVTTEAYKAKLDTMRADVEMTRSLIGTANERLGKLDNSIAQHGAAGLPTQNLQAQRQIRAGQLAKLHSAEQAMLTIIDSAPASVKS